MHKNGENWESFEFLSFSGSFFNHFFGNFSFKKPHLSLQNTIGQRIRALLNVFNILIDDVYRKNGKKCMKTVKIGKVLNFCHFRGHFRHSKKVQKSLQIHIAWN